MDERLPPRLCPRCFVIGEGFSCVDCHRAMEPFGDRLGQPLVIGRIRLLQGPPGIDDLTAGWQGPRRYPKPPERPVTPGSFCRHHDGTLVWLWETFWDNAFSADSAWTYRALAASGSLVLELPAATFPAYRARYARSGKTGAIPEIGPLLDALDNVLDYLHPELKKIALVHPEGERGVRTVTVARIKRRCNQVQVFADEQPALSWCLRMPRKQHPSVGNRISESNTGGVLQIGLVDMGGTLARELLSRLHRITPTTRSTHGVRLLDAVSNGSTTLRQVDHLVGRLPPEVLPAPSWRGEFAYRWGQRTSVRLAIAETSGLPIRLVAVGDNRLRGERALAELLDQDYTQSLEPLVLLHSEDRSDPDLLRWGRRELAAQTLLLGKDDLATVSELVALWLKR